MPSPSLNAKNKPSWALRTYNAIAPKFMRIEPEIYRQEQGMTFNRFGLVKGVDGLIGEISGSGGNQFAIERPSGGEHIDAATALSLNKGFVYAAVNAIAREVMNIEWRLFTTGKEGPEEIEEHDLLDLLDSVNDFMTGPELKYLLSSHLNLTGNSYWYLEGVSNELGKPTAIYPMDPSKVRPLIDKTSYPYQLVGYRMKDGTKEINFQPYQILQCRLPNAQNMFEGYSPVQAAAEYIYNDNSAIEFNGKFFRNGARPAGFLKTQFTSEVQINVLKTGFENTHGGIANMNGIAVLPKDVEWQASGTSPKDMDFKNLSEDSKDRILAVLGVSRTILGTAESDTNRATAETADYVFSKRVIKPHMQLICSFLNENLVSRYGDDLYITFLDPVPEDRAARTEEMKTAVGNMPVLTVDEAREQYMGLGPVDGGDELMSPTSMTIAGQPAPEPKPVAKPPTEEGKEDDEESGKQFRRATQKMAFIPARTKLQKRAKERKVIGDTLGKKIAAFVKEAIENPTHKFSTKEQDVTEWKAFDERTRKAEETIKAEVRRLNEKQKAQVLANLPSAIEKAIDPKNLFDLDNWISIATDAMEPIFVDLFTAEAKIAADALGMPDLEPLTETATAMLHKSVSMMAKSYQQTTLDTLEQKINDGLSSGASLPDISKTVSEIYEWRDTSGADRVATTEAFRTTNLALKETWKQSGVVKTIKWHTAENEAVCPYCQAMDGKIISIDQNFFDEGQTLSVGEGDDAQTMTMDYGDVSAPPLHPFCKCFARPEDVSL
jgi:HK97 family phage portal protein